MSDSKSEYDAAIQAMHNRRKEEFLELLLNLKTVFPIASDRPVSIARAIYILDNYWDDVFDDGTDEPDIETVPVLGKIS